jgi:hypothetical protein
MTQRDFRELEIRLPGTPMSQVIALLGRPSQAFSAGDQETWDYHDVAYDPVTGRAVRRLHLWFKRGVVDDIQASF